LGQEKLFNLGRVKLILEGTGETNRGEFWVLTEEDEWHIMHGPFPGVDPDTGVPVPHRHTIQGAAADVSWWCRADHFQQFDPRGGAFPVYEGLPAGLLPTLEEPQRILAWRAGRPTRPLDSGAGRQVEPTPLDPEWQPSGRGAPNQPPTRAAEQEQGLLSHQEATSATKPVADPTPATSAPPQLKSLSPPAELVRQVPDHRPSAQELGDSDTPPPQNAAKDPRFITLGEAVSYTALSKGYLSKLCDGGTLQTNGIKGRGRRIDSASLAVFMRARRDG
jgi:hypothetical protein